MKSKFIALHLYSSGKLSLVNVADIMTVDDLEDHSFITFFVKNRPFGASGVGYEVRETLSEICRMIADLDREE